MRTKAIFATCILIALAITAIACGSSGKKNDNGGATPSSGSQPTTGATATEVAAGTTPSATDAGASTEGYNPCTLVTRDDAVAALGEDVSEGDLSAKTTIAAIPGVSVTAQSCGYDSTTTAHSVSIDLWSVAAGDASKLKGGVEQIVCAGKEKIADLGQSACWYSPSHDELQVVQDAAFLDLTISKGGTAVDQELMKIAGSAVQRLD
jgi:hypothetical protein